MVKKKVRQERGLSLGRMLRILSILEQRRFGASPDELVEETGYNKRTIYRDIQVLVNEGFELEKIPCD